MGKYGLIDFDKKFRQYMDSWLKENLRSDSDKTIEDLEEEVPAVYAKWVEAEQVYFDQFSAVELIEMLSEYMASEITVPDILCDAILQKKEQTQEPLYKLFKYGVYNTENHMILINLLSAMGSTLPVLDFISIVVQHEEDGEVINAAAEALRFMGEDSFLPLLKAYDTATNVNAKEMLMNAMIYNPFRQDILCDRLIDLFSQSNSKAFIAGLIAEYNDKDCLPALYIAENSKEIDYIDYTEICNAIEALGGNTERNREFEGDAYYDMLKTYTGLDN